jgi:Icc protein
VRTLLAQVTDLHIREPGQLAYRRLDTAPYLAGAVDSLMRLAQRPQAVILTGDLTDFGRLTEYQHLARLLAPLDMPCYLLPGNHDNRENLRRSFASHTYLGSDGFVQYSVMIGPLRLIALDTSEPGCSAGRLCATRLDWLKAELARDRETPTVIAMHHPPFKTLIGHMDEIGLLDGAPQLEAMLVPHPNVLRVICGHLHRTIYTGFARTVASTAPSPAHQVCLDLSDDAQSAWNLEPPGFHLHALTDTGALLTHVVAVGNFEGPFPFHENGQLID